jgi:hypothetical protein
MSSRLVCFGVGLAAVFSLAVASAFAEAPDDSMAPPVQPTDSAPATAAATLGKSDNVFSWQEVPVNQQIPITRAVFDKGGYVLYDTVGETITVPFVNDNLFVMKFGHSTTGDMYFTNDGTAPTLFLPPGGYLENASVPDSSTPGAKWYPFTANDPTSDPQYIGIAPSYAAYENMGWYPDMNCWGGYYGSTSYLDGGVFLPEPGLAYVIGGYPCSGWSGYLGYCSAYPAPYRNRLLFGGAYAYGFSHRFGGGGHVFGGGYGRGGGLVGGYSHGGVYGGGGSYGHGGLIGGAGQYHAFQGALGAAGGRFGSYNRGGFGGYGAAVRTFRGARMGSGGYGVGNHGATFGGYRPSGFRGGSAFAGRAGGSFGGGRSFPGGSFGGGRSFGGQSFHTGSFGSGRSFGGGHSSGGGFGGSHSFGGGRSFGGGHSFSGGRSSGGSRGGGGHR